MEKLRYVDVSKNDLYVRLLKLNTSINTFLKSEKGLIDVECYRLFNKHWGQAIAWVAHALALNCLNTNKKKFYYKQAFFKLLHCYKMLEHYDLPDDIQQQIKDINIIFNKIIQKYKIFRRKKK